MNKNLIFSVLAGLMITTAFLGCKEDEEPPIPKNYSYTVFTVPNTHEPVVGATVYYYYSELDFLLGENEFATGITDELGEHQHRTDSAVIWARVQLGELNNLREYTDHRRLYSSAYGGYKSRQEMENVFAIKGWLTRTPTRLQINVIDNNLNPVQGATVQLFFSQEDFDADIHAQEKDEELKISYALGHSSMPEWFSGTTDVDGVLLFDNLEPKQYWFKVTKDVLTNAATTIKTDKALPDDWNITNVITVRIN